jgi:hypothetical protein
MFSNLGNFEFKRNWKQAIGFYLAYGFLGFLFGVLAGGMAGSLDPDHAQQLGVKAGRITGVIYCLALAVITASKKSLLSSFKVLVLVVLSPLVALFLGALGGLIPVAYLTTRPSEPAAVDE